MIEIAIKSRERLANFSPILFAPAEYVEKGGRKIFYGLKQSLYAVGKITEIPSPFATVCRKITEAVGPSLAYLANCMAKWNAAARNFVCCFEAIDLLEIINDANYFINGGFVKDRAKKHYYSVAAHIALVPVDMITVVLFLKDTFKMSFRALGVCANAIGNFRVFGFVPKVAQWVQNWPLIRSIPNLTGKAAWLGNVRIFGFFTRVSLATTARVLVTAAYIYFAADAWHRKGKYQQKSRNYLDALKQRNIVLKPNDKCPSDVLKRAGIVDPEMRKAVGSEFVKFKHNQIKVKQAKIDFVAAGCEISLKAAAFAGLTAGATVAGSVVFAALGLFTFASVGYSLYYRLTTSKPDLRAII